MFGDRLALNGDGFGHAVVSDSVGFSSLVVPPDQLLAALVDVTPTRAAADAEEMTDRDCHVAAAVNRQVSTRIVLRDQRTDEALVTAVDGTVAQVARHATPSGVGADCAYSRIGAPQCSPKKTVMINNVSDHVTCASYH